VAQQRIFRGEQRDAAADAARKLGLKPRMIEVKRQQHYGGAFNAMDDARGQAIILPAGPMFFRDREAIAQALRERRIPSIAAFRENTEAGVLISQDCQSARPRCTADAARPRRRGDRVKR